MEHKDYYVQYDNNQIKCEPPDEWNLSDKLYKPIGSPKKTVFCTEEEFIRDFGGVVESDITIGEYEYDGVIKSEPLYEQNESEQPKETLDVVESPMTNKHNESEVNFINSVNLISV